MRVRSVLSAAAIAVALAPACSSSDHPAATANVGSGGGANDGGATSDGGASADGGSVAVRPELCQGVDAGPTAADEVSQAGPPSVPLGGTLRLGTYNVEEYDVYGAFDAGTGDAGDGPPGVQATGRTVSGTLVLTKDVLQIVEAFGTPGGSLGAPTTRAYAYVVKGNALNAAQQCPTSAATSGIGYTAVGDALALFPDENHRQLYRLRP
jgi:hypothetical protein